MADTVAPVRPGPFAGEVVYPNGLVDLADYATIQAGPLFNEDLAPVPIKHRTWTTYNFAALWIGMAHNIPTYLLASGLIALGMNWIQALLTISLANIIVLIPMLFNSYPGTEYGIPFPVLSRASFGVFGANVAALLRAFVACGWFGIQTWIGGTAIYTLAGALFGSGWINTVSIGGHPWTMWLSFSIFWLFNIYIILRGMNTLRVFENWAAPFVLLVTFFLLVWMVIEAKGFGPILSQGGKLGWGPGFWALFFPSLMGMIAFWSTLSLNIPDFTRFARNQRSQMIGQALGLPTTMTVFPLMAIIITSATAVVFGKPIWDPIQLVGHFHNPIVVALALFSLAIATLSANVAANVVSPSYDFSNLIPKLISFRTGGLITGVIGILIQPWRLLADPHVYIFTWLGFYGGITGAIAGILIADFWALRKTVLDLPDLYRTAGPYRYLGGWNPVALISLIVGALLAVGGAYSAPAGSGPFPVHGLIPPLRVLYDYSWAVGLVAAFLCYWLLSVLLRVGRCQSRGQEEIVAQPVS